MPRTPRGKALAAAGLAGLLAAGGVTAVLVTRSGGDDRPGAAAGAPSAAEAEEALTAPSAQASLLAPSPEAALVPASPTTEEETAGGDRDDAGGDGDAAGAQDEGAGGGDGAAAPVRAALFVNPDAQVRRWLDDHPDDGRRDVIADSIANRPQGVWFTQYDPSSITGDVRAITSAAEASGTVPVLVSYMLPNRDCGGASSGGAPGTDAYDAWMDRFAAGIGAGPAIVILEPDSLALDDCLSGVDRDARRASLARAVDTLHDAAPQARVYLDAGHSQWHDPAEMADRLEAAGALDGADGIFTNVANFRATDQETAYAKAVLDALGGGLHAVIDTSRNGNGPVGEEWCDPPGRRVGHAPTTDTGDPDIGAYLWVKPPGEADGCAADAGTFSPQIAYDLALGN
ncbi:glycoside hydrolase family 6 protein [Streptomyces sp. RFCAC02]|uniref:glycoside hydrolase family 6 protein n=1 Tax=Streptomyces sp. RFCAC02 TaxID=2499143 RepID=UPI001F10846F|nr:glycoside hydrolase family 6 protein [Streptomyces sp. RFCAC02]